MKQLVICKEQNTLYMCDVNDARDRFAPVTSGVYSKGVLTTRDGFAFKVHGDWSLTAIETDAFKEAVVRAVKRNPRKRDTMEQALLIAARQLAI